MIGQKSIGVKKTNASSVFPGCLGVSTELPEESKALNEAIDGVLEFWANGTPVDPHAFVALDFIAAVKKARGEE